MISTSGGRILSSESVVVDGVSFGGHGLLTRLTILT